MARPDFSYEEYIHPDELPRVERRNPEKDDPDEPFFIRTHQAFEIWFAQILEELEFVRERLALEDVPEKEISIIEQHVRRAASIFDLLRQHLPLLETLLTSSFYDFRRQVFGASGSQSTRFVEIEWLLGLRDDAVLEYTRKRKETEQKLSGKVSGQSELEHRSLVEYRKRFEGSLPPKLEGRSMEVNDNSIRYWLFRWLARTPYPSKAGSNPSPEDFSDFRDRFEEAFRTAHRKDLEQLQELKLMAKGDEDESWHRVRSQMDWYFSCRSRQAIVFILQFAEQPLLAWPASLLDAFLQLDEALTNWRTRHITMVARVLGGGRISTVGQERSGLEYLSGSAHKRAFPELWDARTFLLGAEEASNIYPQDAWKGFGLRFSNV